MSSQILSRPAPPPDARIAYGTGEQHYGDLRVPKQEGPHPLAICIHGGYWRAQHSLTYMGHTCEALRASGIATWNIEYRRIGQGGGYPGTFADVAVAADYVRELAPRYSLDLTRTLTLGHSAGGHLAAWLAARPRLAPSTALYTPSPLVVAALVSLAGVLDLRRGWELRLSDNIIESLLRGTPAQVPERYAAASPYDLLPLHVPQCLIHGSADTNVPLEITARHYEAARAAGDEVEQIVLDGVGHFEIVDPNSGVWPCVLDATRRAAQRSTRG